MNSLRQKIYLCKGMVREAIFSPRILCGYLIGFSGVIYGIVPYIKYTQDTVINLFEPFIILLNQRSFVTYLLMGYFLLICNAPFVNSRSQVTILRTTRQNWIDSMLIYIFTQTVCYYLFIFLFTIVVAAPKGFVGNMWSNVFYMISNYGSGAAAKAGVIVPQITFLQSWSVYEACIHSVLLLILYSLVIAVLLFLGNLGVRRFIGSIGAVAIHFIGYLIISDALLSKIQYSLLANGILAYHDSSDMYAPRLSFSYGLFGFLLVLLCYLLHIEVRHCDLRNSVSERYV